MWSDNETQVDFLNFSGIANTIAEIIIGAEGRPISIGVSGEWGAGKSSMIKLARKSLEIRTAVEGQKIIFVEFNAWLYQGFDDARAALMEVIAQRLMEEAENRKTGLDKARELMKRVGWIRALKLGANIAASIFVGAPTPGLAGSGAEVGGAILSGSQEQMAAKKAGELIDKAVANAPGLINPPEVQSVPKEISTLRLCFEETIQGLNVTLVVLIDDLDRCLPATTISTLEAIRLFLFLEGTAFVIAADDEMIKFAVKNHFSGVDGNIATKYFDKLIQVPIRVPALGTQEIRAYLLMLFIESSSLESDRKDFIREQVCIQLAHSWQGKRVDRAFIQSLHANLPADLVNRLDTADRLAHLMTMATDIHGNPRLIKRFLNALWIRMTISRAQGVGVDEAALMKMLLFERSGNPDAFVELVKSVTGDEEGRPKLLSEWEEKAFAGEPLFLPAPWDGPFIEEWLALPPRLGEMDLRGVLYVSREAAPLVFPEDRLSSLAAELLSGLLAHPEMSGALVDRLKRVPRLETSVLMDRLLERARQEQEWGAPPILEACLSLSDADPAQAPRLAGFLSMVPPLQVRPNLIPKISDRPWAQEVFANFEKSGVSEPVKQAIKREKIRGHLTVK